MLLILNDELCKVKSASEYCLKLMSKHRPKIGGILYDHGIKSGTHYSDLELGSKFCNWVEVPGSGYKPLLNKNREDHSSLF